MDRMLKANTVKKRTHSLLRQGAYYYAAAILTMKDDLLERLLTRFGEYILQHPVYVLSFSLK